MQFGQLLTHLDTTQQMINNSLKDNNTLLTQVGHAHNTHCACCTAGDKMSLHRSVFDWSCLPSATCTFNHAASTLFSPNGFTSLSTWSLPLCARQVQQTMKENLAAVEENFAALDQRIKKLSN